MSHPRYPAYKPSGVPWLGDVPSHWEVLPLLAVMKESYAPNTGNAVSTVLSLSYGRIVVRDVESNMGLLPDSFETYQIVKPGDIVLRLTDLQNDQRSLRVGKVSQPGIITSAYVALRAVEGVSKDFCHLLLHGYDLLKVFYAQGGGVRQTMKYDDLKRLPIPLPPPEEQRAIAAFLDRETAQIDALIARLEALVALLQEKRQALISHAVTKGLDPTAPMKESGVEWLGEVPGHWEVERNKWLFREVDQRSELGDEELLSVSHITGVTPRSEKNVTMFMAESNEGYKVCRPGDLVINTMWAYMGALGISSHHGIVSPSYNVYRLINDDLLDSKYLDLLYRTPVHVMEIKRNSRGVWESRLRLYPDEFFEMYTPVPPRREQELILQYLAQLTDQMAVVSDQCLKTIELLRERRAALISAAVTGQIDVRK